MPEIEVTVLQNIVAQYEADLKKAERDFDKAKKKLEYAKMQAAVGRDMLAKAQEGSAQSPPRSLGDWVLEIVNAETDGGITAKDILAKLKENGQEADLAAVHVAADRLAESEKIEREKTPDGKLYRRKAQQTEEDPT